MNPSETPRGAGWWAKRWSVHRNTARRLLRHLHRQYGPRVVWRVGPRQDLVATEASLQVVQILRAERNLILVVGAHHGQQHAPERDDDDIVTRDQHGRALAEVWRALEKLGVRRF